MNPETIDLSNFGDRSLDFTVTREAGFDNTVDFYPVDADGNVTDSDENIITPDENGYLGTAISNRLGADISTDNGVTSQFTVEFSGGAFYTPLLAIDSDFSAFTDSDDSNDPIVYFTYEEANIDGFDHVIGTDTQLTFEDLPDGGDEDFNDIVLDFELVADEPVEQEPETEETVDETPVAEEESVEETPVMEKPEVEEPVMEKPEGDGSISGLKFNDFNNSGFRDSELVQGENPDVVFVFDVSGSTNRFAQGTPIDNDGTPTTIFEAETEAFIRLNQQLIDQNLGDNVDIGIIAFGRDAVQLDLNPITDGIQLTTTPDADLGSDAWQ